MRITKDNYEQYFLDHAEGNLSHEMERELADFLDANPDLRAVLSEFDPSPLQTVEIHNDILKARLKKHLYSTDHIREDNLDEWMIRDIEGLLDEAEENELKEFLALNPAYTFDYKIFGYTKLAPDLSVTYRQKNELKRKVVRFPVRRLAWLLPATAAVILLFIGIRLFVKPQIQPAHPVSLPIAEIPTISSPGIVANFAIPVMEQKRTPSQDHPVQITRGKTGRLNSIAVKKVDIPDQTESASLYLADFDYSPILASEKKEPSLIAKVFNNMIAKARNGFGRNSGLEEIDLPDFNFWAMAKAGIEGYNSISDRELELLVRKDDEGKVKAYALIDEERLILSKELNKE